MAQGPAVSIGQRGAVDRAGWWGGTWQVPVLALASTSCVPSGKPPPSLGLGNASFSRHAFPEDLLCVGHRQGQNGLG